MMKTSEKAVIYIKYCPDLQFTTEITMFALGYHFLAFSQDFFLTFSVIDKYKYCVKMKVPALSKDRKMPEEYVSMDCFLL
jgi:hypothetical protein